MVKGISKQVIVLQQPQTRLFEQAIFILKETSPAVTDQQLLREAERLINQAESGKKPGLWHCGPAWACVGAGATALIWLLSVIL